MTTYLEQEGRRGRFAAWGAGGLWGPFWLAVLLAGSALLFEEGFRALFIAWQTAEYSHGPLIPVLSGLLFLRQLKTVPPYDGPVNDRWAGVLVILLAAAMGILGKFTQFDDVVAYALIVMVAGIILTSFGLTRGWQFWPGVLHLVFMLPLPATLYWKTSTTLQLISSELGVYFVQLANVPVFLEGNIIDLGVYRLHVAEACSGLRYLFPIMSFSYVFATLYRGPTWHKAVLLLSAAPITVLMNSVRIGLIGIMVDRFGIEHAEGLSHFLEGWVIFITCVLMLFGLAWAMLKLQASPMTLSEALDLDTTGLGEQIMRVRDVRPSPALIASALTIVGLAITWQLIPERGQARIDREPLALMSSDIGGWELRDTRLLEPRIEKVLAADDYFSGSYVNPDEKAPIELFIAWYRDQTRGGIHSPEVCLPGGGWEMAEINRVDLGPGLGMEHPFRINRAIIQKGASRLLVYYWFEQYGGRKASDIVAKLALLRDALLYDRSDGALVRMITPIRPGESDVQAEARLTSMMPGLVADLPRYVPSHEAERAPR